MEEYYKKSKTPHIQIIDINNEGTEKKPNVSFEVNDAFLDMIKKEKNIDLVSQEDLSDYVYELMKNCSNKKNGYDYEKLEENPENL